MEEFDVKIHQNGAIYTVHVMDAKGGLDVGIGETVEEAAGQAVSKMYARKGKGDDGPARNILKDFLSTADADKAFEEAEELFGTKL